MVRILSIAFFALAIIPGFACGIGGGLVGILASVDPVRETIARRMLCPDAINARFEYRGTVYDTPGGTRRASLVTMTCTNANGTTQRFENDQFAGTALAGAIGIGGIVAVVIAVVLLIVIAFSVQTNSLAIERLLARRRASVRPRS